MNQDDLKKIVKSGNRIVPIITLVGTVLIAYLQLCLDMYILGHLQVIGVDLCYSSEMNLKGRFAVTIIIAVLLMLSCVVSYYLTSMVLFYKEKIKRNAEKSDVCFKIEKAKIAVNALIEIAADLMHAAVFCCVSYFFLCVSISLLLPFKLVDIIKALPSEEKLFIFLFAVILFGAVFIVWPSTKSADTKESNNHNWRRIILAGVFIIVPIIAVFGITTYKSLGENLARDNREYKVIVSELPNDTERKKDGKNQLVLYEGKEIYILSDYREVDDNKGEKKTLQIFNSRQVVVDKKEIETVTREYDDVIFEPDDNPHSESSEIDRN